MNDRWNHGELIVRREVLGYTPTGKPPPQAPWGGKAWLEVPVYVVEDSEEQLVTYTATGAEFGFPSGEWPSPGGRHPWSTRRSWDGHGCLMIQRPGEHYAVWHFWDGPDRDFSFWYVNMQTEFRRTADGYDTQDLEVDVIVRPDGSWILKDYELLEDRLAEGRFWPELVEWIRTYTAELTDEIAGGRFWWDEGWTRWSPPEAWVEPRLARD